MSQPEPSNTRLQSSRLDVDCRANSFDRDNAIIYVLEARQSLQQEADDEVRNVHRPDFIGRQFLQMSFLLNALYLRSGRRSDSEIESTLSLRPGVMNRLGPRGLIDVAFTGNKYVLRADDISQTRQSAK